MFGCTDLFKDLEKEFFGGEFYKVTSIEGLPVSCKYFKNACEFKKDKDGKFIKTIEIPGYPAKNVTVKGSGRKITVSANKDNGIKEISFIVPENLSLDLKAKLKNGILTITTEENVTEFEVNE